MSTKPFHFKEFSIIQDKTAMKVGTDGVLLGAWVTIENEMTSVLDIGTGTGLIALQIAQKSDCEIIDAIEIEPNAYEQAVENFENSPWADRLFCYHASLKNFVIEMDDKYDLIISNPPYYRDTYKNLEQKRAMARHTESLSFEDLLSATAKLLTPKGNCAFVIPFHEEDKFLKIASKFNLYPTKILRVKGNNESPVKRTLLQLSFKKTIAKTDILIIETERHIYTKKYKNLVKEYYLKL